ncbi:hypothetical protein [Vibrio barjaei]|uniref:hypothetical protein n=1 Tax=Vibrio barjaei TaxID=1676683 RepID=UPI002284C70C|nr:hypothetical protein [Vibrio barjaei]MCY9872977.1 hypothetical protein [Vibrio barjaei]
MIKLIMIPFLMLSNFAYANTMTPSAGGSNAGIWDSVWTGSYGTISSLTHMMMYGCMFLFMAWVTKGLYVAWLVNGQLSASEALFLFIRMMMLSMFTFAVLT